MTQPKRKRGPVLTTRALRAINDSLSAHLAGPEGEGDLADVAFDDLHRAKDWVEDQLERREARKVCR